MAKSSARGFKRIRKWMVNSHVRRVAYLGASAFCLLTAAVLAALLSEGMRLAYAQEQKGELPADVLRYTAELKRVRTMKQHETIEPLFTTGMQAIGGSLAETVQFAGPDYKFSLEKALEGFEIERGEESVMIYPRFTFFANMASSFGVAADKEFFAIGKLILPKGPTYAFLKNKKADETCVTFAHNILERAASAMNVYDLKYPDSYSAQREEWSDDLWKAALEDNCVCDSQAATIKALTSLVKAVKGRRQEQEVRARLNLAKAKDSPFIFNCAISGK